MLPPTELTQRSIKPGFGGTGRKYICFGSKLHTNRSICVIFYFQISRLTS